MRSKFDAIWYHEQLHGLNCTAVSSKVGVRSFQFHTVATMNSAALGCGCLVLPDLVTTWRAQYEPFVQALSATIRFGYRLETPSPAQVRKWRKAFRAVTHPDLITAATAGMAVLDEIVGDNEPAVGMTELAVLQLVSYRTDRDQFVFGDATDWWPKQTLVAMRDKWFEGFPKLDSTDTAAGWRDSLFESATPAETSKFAISGAPRDVALEMFNRWFDQVVVTAGSPEPCRAVLISVRYGKVRDWVRNILACYQQATIGDEETIRSIVFVPKSLCRALFTDETSDGSYRDLGPLESHDSRETARTALGLMADVGADRMMEAARALAS